LFALEVKAADGEVAQIVILDNLTTLFPISEVELRNLVQIL
jgi:hypothetical protein